MTTEMMHKVWVKHKRREKERGREEKEDGDDFGHFRDIDEAQEERKGEKKVEDEEVMVPTRTKFGVLGRGVCLVLPLDSSASLTRNYSSYVLKLKV